MFKINTIKIFVFFLISNLTNAYIANAQTDNQVIVAAQLKPKLEIRDGAFRPLLTNEKPAALISERIRLSINYQYKDLIELNISPQTVSIWGQANMVQKTENSGNRLAIFEAWSKLKIAQNWNIKAGRQVISLDDERIFGELDWAQGGRVHDALTIQHKSKKIDFRAYMAYNQNYKTLYANNSSNITGNSYSTVDALPYKWMQTIWLGFPLSKSSNLSFLVSNLGLQNATLPTDSLVRYSQTLGTNYNYKGTKTNAQIAIYFQTGKDITGTNTSAYYLSGQIGTKINSSWNLALGSDLISGSDLGIAQQKNTVFNPYFSTGHKFFGSMDYFYAGNGHKNVGISDTYLKVNYNASSKTALNMALHQFFTPNTVKDMSRSYKKDLGSELDLGFSYKINTFAKVMGGYSFYLTNPTINYLKSTVSANKYQQWAWLSLNVNPTIFNSKF